MFVLTSDLRDVLKAGSMRRAENVPPVAIALASYNGGSFLEAQIESIRSQDYTDWLLIVRDDGSSDETVKILKHFCQKDSRIILLSDESGHLGASRSFSWLANWVNRVRFEYCLFSDQDDIWLPTKISLQMKMMHSLEEIHPNKPILIHSDLQLVDEELGLLNDSFMQFSGIHDQKSDPLQVALVQNYVTGCSVMVNHALMKHAIPVPGNALMHDWWMTLCAAVFGYIGYIDEPLVKYRQHSHNKIGAKHLDDFINPVSGKWKKRWYEGRYNLFQSMKQAQALADRIREHDPKNPNLALVEAYAALQNMPPLKRIGRLHVLGIHAQSRSRQALLLSRLLLTSKTQYD